MPGGSYSHKKWITGLLLVFAGSGLLWSGCGQKGPPRPPSRPLLPAIKDLAFNIHDGRVELTWTVPVTGDRKGSYPAAVKVFRSRVPVEEAGCKNCPIRYTMAGDIPIQKRRSDISEPIRMSYAELIEPGYRYIFKVIVYDEDGTGGRDSNVVRFDYNPD